MKKLLSLLLALTMVFSLAVTAFAAEGGDNGETEPATTPVTGTNDNNGKITINNAVVGQTYTIYELLTLESYNTTTGSYAYKATTAWESWLKTQTSYVTVNDKGFVTWVANTDAATAAAFAKAAKAYAKEKSIAGNGTATATTTTVVFENLNLGYYLVDSTLGTLCSLDTTNKEVNIQEKNAVPSNEKKVQEDSDNKWYDHNDADIGQTVNFKSTVTLPAGSENVVFKDTMSAGLTLKADSIKVYTDEAMTTQLAAANYTLTTSGLTDCTFKIAFAQSYLDGLTNSATVYVAYSATVNNQAVVGLNGNKNESWLDYGDSTNTQSTPKSETITYTWDVEVLKYANNNKQTVLKGVKFVLLNSDKTKVAKVVNGKVASWETIPTAVDNQITWPANTVLTTGEDGKIKVEGLDADKYFLREIETLPGFNLIDDKEFTVKGAETDEDGKKTYETLVIEVNNNSGTELPSTGGAGTTLFYVLGSILVLAAVVLLVTKKRMSAEG